MLSNIQHIYFIGIGGIGMSSIARWFKAHQFWVAGYDRTPSSVTDALIEEGIAIHFEDDISFIPSIILDSPKENTLIIYTPAIPQDHKELNFFLQNQYRLHKRAEVLGWLTRDFFTIAVAGTHGKTTTSSMIAHILHQAGKPCTAFLGGILQNYDSNLLLHHDQNKETWMVVEADEYDRSFLHLQPDIAVITSMDADHLDIYGDFAQIQASFEEFVQLIRPKGRLFIHSKIEYFPQHLPTEVELQHYSLNMLSDFKAENILIQDHQFYFDFISQNTVIKQICLQVSGFHNVENALVATAVALSLGVEESFIREALATFKGAKRRFEYIIRSEELVLIDDYAHHPAEIEAFLQSVRAIYPHRKITAIFQPHLFTRTRDLLEDFAKSLSLADELLLLDIYPAREQPIEGVSSQLLLDKVDLSQKQLVRKEDLLSILENSVVEVVVMMGAGDIDRWVGKVKNVLERQ